jgi:hypothetical protein
LQHTDIFVVILERSNFFQPNNFRPTQPNSCSKWPNYLLTSWLLLARGSRYRHASAPLVGTVCTPSSERPNHSLTSWSSLATGLLPQPLIRVRESGSSFYISLRATLVYLSRTFDAPPPPPKPTARSLSPWPRLPCDELKDKS